MKLSDVTSDAAPAPQAKMRLSDIKTPMSPDRAKQTLDVFEPKDTPPNSMRLSDVAPAAAKERLAAGGESLVSTLGKKEGEALDKYAGDIQRNVREPFKKDKTAGPEILQRIGDAGGRVGSTLADIVGLATSPVEAAAKTGIKAVLPAAARGLEAVIGDPRFKASNATPEALNRVADDTGDLVAQAVFAPTAVKGPGAARALGKAAEEVATPIKQILSPASASPKAERVAGIKRETLGEANRDTAATEAALQKYSRQISSLPDADRLKMLEFMEGRSKGVRLHDPSLLAAADDMRAAFKQREAKLKAIPQTAHMGFIEDYFVHEWKDPKQAQQFIQQFVGKQGSGKNLNKRVLPTISDGLKAGLDLKTTNPLESTMRYVANMDKFIAHNEAFNMMRQEKLARFFMPGKQPPGWVQLTGRLAEKVAPAGKGGNVVVMKAFAPEDAARVYNNFLSRGFTDAPGKLYDMTQKTFNAITTMKLGLVNTYHAGATGMAAIGSDVGRGVRQLAKRDMRGLKTIAKAPAAPVRLAMVGNKYNKQYLRIANYGPDAEKLVETATRANSMPSKRPDYMRASGYNTFTKAWKNGTLKAELAADALQAKTGAGAAAKVFTKNMGRFFDTVAEPMFDRWIPDVKRGATIERLQQWVEEHPASTYEEQLAAARQIGDSMDNRFGEMMRDNLFWNQTLRNGLQLGFLSYSWVTGAARMVGNAGKGLAQTALKGKELNADAEYLIGVAMTYAVVNSIAQVLKTGKPPQTVKDLLFYQTGGQDHGAAERGVIPGHTLQFAEYLHDPLRELANEANPGLTTVYDLLRNRDYRNLPIGDPSDMPDYIKRYGKFLMDSFEPISLQNFERGAKEGSNLSTGERLGGVRSAPQFITNPEGAAGREDKAFKNLWRRKLRSDSRLEGEYENINR